VGTETEYKFLIDPARLPPLREGRHFTQGYLATNPTVRVRLSEWNGDAEAFLTIKGPGLQMRPEFEYPIPVPDARELLPLCGERVLTKTRFVHEGWEIDEFHGFLKGFWLAEYELKHAADRLPALPRWVRKDVTGDPRYSNAALIFSHGAPNE
jgi:CYTH domain-containing protein